MNPPQMYNLTDLTRTIGHKFVGSKLKGERLYNSVKMKGIKFTGQLRGRAKHWLVIDANLPNPDFVSPDFPIERAEYTGSTLLFIDLSKIDSDMSMILQWSQNNAFLQIHILGTRKPSTEAERPTKRRRIGDANTNHIFNQQALDDHPNGTISLATFSNPVATAYPTPSSLQHIQQDSDPLSTLFYASNTSYSSNPPSTVAPSNTNVLTSTREQSENKLADESSSESSEEYDYDDETRAFKLLAQAKDQLKSPDAKIRAECMWKICMTVGFAPKLIKSSRSATELIKSNPILADTVCQCVSAVNRPRSIVHVSNTIEKIIIGMQDKETRIYALVCLLEASDVIGQAMKEYHEDILPLLIEAALNPVESTKLLALCAVRYYLLDSQVPASLIEEHFDELMTNLIRTINEPVEWDEDLNTFRRNVFNIILTLISKYPHLNFNEYIYKLLPHIKMALDEGDKCDTKTAKELIQKLLKPVASTALELCSLVLEATKEDGNTDIEDRFKSSMMNVLNGSAPNFSDSYSDS